MEGFLYQNNKILLNGDVLGKLYSPTKSLQVNVRCIQNYYMYLWCPISGTFLKQTLIRCQRYPLVEGSTVSTDTFSLSLPSGCYSQGYQGYSGPVSNLIWSTPPIRHLAISSAFFGRVQYIMMNSSAIVNSETKTLPDQENHDEKEVWHKHRHIPSPAEISLHTWKKITLLWLWCKK